MIESLLSVNIPTVFEMEYMQTNKETFVTLFFLLRHMLHCLPEKVIVLSLLSKGINHLISYCIKSMWMWLVKNLQKFCNFQFLAAVPTNQYPVTKTSLIDTYINHKLTSLYWKIKKNSCTNYWERMDHFQMIIFTAFRF